MRRACHRLSSPGSKYKTKLILQKNLLSNALGVNNCGRSEEEVEATREKSSSDTQ